MGLILKVRVKIHLFRQDSATKLKAGFQQRFSGFFEVS
jgi:hypothetical protein